MKVNNIVVYMVSNIDLIVVVEIVYPGLMVVSSID